MNPILQGVLAATASFFIISLICLFILVFCKSRKEDRIRRRQHQTRSAPNNISESATFDPSLPRVSMPDLLRATKNFSPDLIIGDGSFGLVYKASLCNGKTVAIKKLSADAFQGFREFRAEMETLGKIQHKNIVKILGFCATGWDRVLIYEFIEKGSLDQWLCDTSTTDSNSSTSLPRHPLSWETRVNVVKDVAQGLCYMHNLGTPIIHRDIKASNILLDTNFGAHIADFGLARRIEGTQSHVSTQVAGTMGYMPPEYIHGSTIATTMGDVYSFGILMFEIATGKRPSWPVKGDGKEIGLIDWVRDMVKNNKQMDMIDANIFKEELKQGQVVEFFRIASLCTNDSWKSRPGMKEVVKMLDGISTLN